jgi:hypothetical protein
LSVHQTSIHLFGVWAGIPGSDGRSDVHALPQLFRQRFPGMSGLVMIGCDQCHGKENHHQIHK